MLRHAHEAFAEASKTFLFGEKGRLTKKKKQKNSETIKTRPGQHSKKARLHRLLMYIVSFSAV